MKLLQREKLRDRIAATDASRIFIEPLLDQSQLGALTLDMRLGNDFLVSLLTRRPSINAASPQGADGVSGIGSYFRTTRRDLGDRFVVYPSQVVLATTLEYVGLPSDVYADVISRSSFNRLGIHLNTMIQPGFRECFPLELFNHGNNPVELIVGGRIVQARFIEVEGPSAYQTSGVQRKYYGNVRPMVSRAQSDDDLAILSRVRK